MAKVGSKGRTSVNNNLGGGASHSGYVVDQASRNNGGSDHGGKSSGAKARMDGNCKFGATEHGSKSVVDVTVGPGKERGRTAEQMGPTAMSPKGQYADRMHVGGGFGGAKSSKGVNG